ncbi:hypothetical protein GQ43DRAFT_235362 [Delitschia confertaspora ATCC 74209]|uniref:C2H2-type domain-containing protein n=1 Tax=Delitschia confertaspora ATCC 74209 TaxID=1513339 RepID=A0A9P4JHL3_9PLEO|nr:hypothetical protein GQ43DRAFT_235362 [Delitschia confertaspora ATCC 74209]
MNFNRTVCQNYQDMGGYQSGGILFEADSQEIGDGPPPVELEAQYGLSELPAANPVNPDGQAKDTMYYQHPMSPPNNSTHPPWNDHIPLRTFPSTANTFVNPQPNTGLAGMSESMASPCYASPQFLPQGGSLLSGYPIPSYAGQNIQSPNGYQHGSVHRGSTSTQYSPISPIQLATNGYQVPSAMSSYDTTDLSSVSRRSSAGTTSIDEGISGSSTANTQSPVNHSPYNLDQHQNYNAWSRRDTTTSFSEVPPPAYSPQGFASPATTTDILTGSQHVYPIQEAGSPWPFDANSFNTSSGLVAPSGYVDSTQQYHNLDPPPEYEISSSGRALPAQENAASRIIHNHDRNHQGRPYEGYEPRRAQLLSRPPLTTVGPPVTEVFRQLACTPIIDTTSCDECGKKFIGVYRKGNLKRHKKNIHATEPRPDLICGECSKTYRRDDALKKHQRKKHQMGSKRKRNVPNRLLSSVTHLLQFEEST